MRRTVVLICTASLAALVGCATPQEKAAKAQERAYKAEAEIKEERLALIEQYKKCVADAGNDNARREACDSYLKAIEALK